MYSNSKMLILCWRKHLIYVMNLVILHCFLDCVSIFIRKFYSIDNVEVEIHAELKSLMQNIFVQTFFLCQ